MSSLAAITLSTCSSDRISQRKFVCGEPRRIGVREAWSRVILGIEAISRHTMKEFHGLLPVREQFAGADPKRHKIALAIESLDASAVLCPWHVLLEIVLDQIPQAFSNGDVLSRLNRLA
jgi:hypothetical protein